MSNDISSMYTKEQNIKHGGHCYGLWKQEKETIIPPNKYGIFLADRKKKDSHNVMNNDFVLSG